MPIDDVVSFCIKYLCWWDAN